MTYSIKSRFDIGCWLAITAFLIVGALVSSQDISGALPLAIALSFLVYFAMASRQKQRDALEHLEIRLLNSFDTSAETLRKLHLRLPLPRMRGPGDWTIKPDFAALLVEMILDKNPAVVVELGSGVSTLVAGYALERVGSGKLFSFDHSEEYAAHTREELRRHKLQEQVEVITAPIESLVLDSDDYPWYQKENFDRIIGQIDMLVIDGPPASLRKNARYPALPVLIQRMSPSCVVLLDDSIRKDEQQIVEKWLSEYPDFSSEYIPTEKGTLVLTRNAEGKDCQL